MMIIIIIIIIITIVMKISNKKFRLVGFES